MSLTKLQMEEIVRFDWKRRTGLDFDGRRYGSITGAHAPHLTECWSPCHGSHVFKGSKKPPRKTLRYNYIEVGRAPAMPLGEVFAGKAEAPKAERDLDVTVVHVAVRLDGAYRPVVKDVARWHLATGLCEMRDMDCRPICGWVVYWDRRDYESRKADPSGDMSPREGTPVDCKWWNGGKWKFGGGATFPFHETVNLDTLKGTRYEYCQYRDDIGPIGLVDWLMLYRQEPKVELLAKAKLFPLISPSGLAALKDRNVFDFVRKNMGEIAGKKYLRTREILYAARHGTTLKDAQRRFEFVERAKGHLDGCRVRAWCRMPEGDQFKFRVDYDRLRRTLPKWRVSVEEYARYLEYAFDNGLDLRNEGTLYPPTRGGRKAFMARLEALEAADAKRRREEERARRAAARKAKAERKAAIEAENKYLASIMEVRMAEIDAFQKSVLRSGVLKGSGYTLILAKTQKELLAEGRRMGNCVGNGMYGRGILTGDKLIVMLGLGGKSYCDIEIDRQRWIVCQCYLKGNTIAPDAVHKLAKKIAACLKAIHQSHKKRHMFKALERKAS